MNPIEDFIFTGLVVGVEKLVDSLLFVVI